jgi:alpha-tubulin suppressor-like RCC1 family protein
VRFGRGVRRIVLVVAVVAGFIVVIPPVIAGATSNPLTSVAQVSSGETQSCALLTTGTVRCWGGGVTSPVPLKTANDVLTNITEVSAGFRHTCALRSDTTVWCWGDNSDGELGNRSTANTVFAVEVRNPSDTGFLTGVAHVNASDYQTCAAMLDGSAVCWGSGLRDAAGDDAWIPVVMNGAGGTPLMHVVKIMMGDQFYGPDCVLLDDATARCWGGNANGELGNGSLIDSSTPVVVENPAGTGPLTGIADISVSYSDQFVCAHLINGTAACWGINDYGQMGIGTTTGPQTCQFGSGCATKPVVVENSAGTGPLTGVAEVAVGFDDACARMSDGTVSCWGRNDAGSLGDGTVTNRSLPVGVRNATNTDVLENVADISTGSYATCAHTNDGGASCWGVNRVGELGNGNTTNTRLPVTVGDGGLPVTPAPDSPTGVSATPGFEQATVSWTAPVSDHGTAIAWYDVTASPSTLIGPITFAVAPATSVVVPFLQGGIAYTFTVHAISLNGDSIESAPSNSVAPIGPPEAPTAPVAIPRNGGVTATWSAPVNPGSSPITGYIVTGHIGGTTLAPVEFDSTATSEIIGGLTNGQIYNFNVIAINASGQSDVSPNSDVVIVGMPTAPKNTHAAAGAATASTGLVSVTYTAGPANGSSISSHTATCTSSNGGATKTVSRAGPAAVPITVSGLTTKKSYVCVVRAVNEGALSPPSPASPAVIVGTPRPVAAPATVKVAAGSLKVTTAAPAANGAPITSYTDTCTSSNHGVARAKTAAPGPIVVTGLTPGKTYTCYVRATNSRGTGLPSAVSVARVA